MGILQIVTRNFEQGSRTRWPTDEVVFPEGFRGALAHNPELCTACETCAYVCSPRAIRFEKQPDSVLWEYFAGQCTFCGRCVEYCPCTALSFQEERPHITDDPAQLHTAHRIFYQHCARCDRPIIPLPEQVLARLYGHAPAANLVAEQKLCEDCRRKDAASCLKMSRKK